MPRSSALAAAVAAADPTTRLNHLVAAWRVKRAPELVDAILSLGAKLDRRRGIMPGETVDARIESWLERERVRDDASTGWLLATPPLHATTLHHYTSRMKRVARWQPDPRLGHAMIALVRDASFEASVENYGAVLDQLRACGDATYIPLLIGPRARQAASEFWAPRLDALVARLAKIKPAKLTAAEKRLVAELRDPTNENEADLLAAIYDAPDDDAPRIVYADWLQEQGDPRGEFITLQCTPELDVAGQKRMRELFGKYKLSWLGPLEPAILEKRSFAFQRGFLATCYVCAWWGSGPKDTSEPRERAIRSLYDHPAWATLREVKLSRRAERPRAALIAHLRELGVTVTFTS